MGNKSAIEWTDSTWNPVTGCTKITRGCDNCYAERLAERFRGTPGHPFENGVRSHTSPRATFPTTLLETTANGFRQFDERPVSQKDTGGVHRSRFRHHGNCRPTYIPGSHKAKPPYEELSATQIRAERGAATYLVRSVRRGITWQPSESGTFRRLRLQFVFFLSNRFSALWEISILKGYPGLSSAGRAARMHVP